MVPHVGVLEIGQAWLQQRCSCDGDWRVTLRAFCRGVDGWHDYSFAALSERLTMQETLGYGEEVSDACLRLGTLWVVRCSTRNVACSNSVVQCIDRLREVGHCRCVRCRLLHLVLPCSILSSTARTKPVCRSKTV